ncbi:hypothetical protein M413DRAFT_9523 [Hebeloma cylindrosporum]|uniref:2OGFeDO JBP1/TET oxygenase domain-containing protein n=1 Tax=Hebeloma cylindrosporum TaxID=76867 RepID=A0A0C3C3I9_HEBCY|nr:hypothetical protein M413DRAFT_9523 [Hebeloma cylindrosporum h7]
MEPFNASLPMWKLTDRMAMYMNKRFQAIIQKQEIAIPFPREWSIPLLMDCNLAVDVVARAFGNRVSTGWDAHDYVGQLSPRNTGQNPAVEANLRKEFPPIHEKLREYNTPLLVTDKNGNALTWYLPGAVSRSRQDLMWSALKLLEPELKVKHTDQWRTAAENYRDPRESELKPGTVSMSPAWFEQGHDTEKYALKVSRPLVAEDSAAGRWLGAMMESSALIGGILSLVHPDLYHAGRDLILHLDQNPGSVDRPDRLRDILLAWTAPFQGLSVISNRVTPAHRDINAARESMDVLVALGKYRNGTLNLPGIGVALQYNPGTVAVLAARLLLHSAECDGERACVAYYMREKVQQRLGIAQPGWFCPEKID